MTSETFKSTFLACNVCVIILQYKILPETSSAYSLLRNNITGEEHKNSLFLDILRPPNHHHSVWSVNNRPYSTVALVVPISILVSGVVVQSDVTKWTTV